MQLKPQDVAVVMKFVATRQPHAPIAQLAKELKLSVSEMRNALRRATASQLIAVAPTKTNKPGRPLLGVRVNRAALVEFVTHGLRYVFLAKRGALARGMPTGRGAAPLNELLGDEGPVPVWPDAKGEVRGESWSPLYPGAPYAARIDPRFYELLALADGLRSDSPRDREFATKLFKERVLQ